MMLEKYKKENIEYIVENYPNHGTAICQEKTGLTINQITRIVRTLKIKVNPASRSKIVQSSNKKFKHKIETRFNILDFESPNSPEISYLLGFLWADASIRYKENDYINKIKAGYNVILKINSKDFIDILPSIKKTGEWRISYHQPKNTKWKKLGSASISSKSLVLFFKKYDYLVKSGTSADKILSIIPDHLKHYWFRGLFDGDGCFYVSPRGTPKVEISSCFKQDWKYLINLCDHLNLHYTITHKEVQKSNKTHRSSGFNISTIDSVCKFLDFIYQGKLDNLKLSRKYLKFIDFKDKIKLKKEDNLKNRGITFSKREKKYYLIDRESGKYLGYFNTFEEAKQERMRLLHF